MNNRGRKRLLPLSAASAEVRRREEQTRLTQETRQQIHNRDVANGQREPSAVMERFMTS